MWWWIYFKENVHLISYLQSNKASPWTVLFVVFLLALKSHLEVTTVNMYNATNNNFWHQLKFAVCNLHKRQQVLGRSPVVKWNISLICAMFYHLLGLTSIKQILIACKYSKYCCILHARFFFTLKIHAVLLDNGQWWNRYRFCVFCLFIICHRENLNEESEKHFALTCHKLRQ